MIIHLCASQAESKAIVVLFKLNSYHLTQMICVLMIVRAMVQQLLCVTKIWIQGVLFVVLFIA